MTISSDYETALTAVQAVATACEAAAAAITEPKVSDGSSVSKATLQKAADNARAAAVALRGPGSTNAGPSDQVREKLEEQGL
jgi:hypothetical protein